MNALCILSSLIVAVLLPAGAHAHESFLIWHDHHLHLDDHGTEEAEHSHVHVHEEHDAKDHRDVEFDVHAESRWTVGTGLRYTRLSFEGEPADFWEIGVGISFAATPWLHVGGEASYGWFDSSEGSSGGWLMPHFHAEVEFPLAKGLEVSFGAELGIPGGDEGLVGEHWELAPSIAVHYERGRWFAEAGASFFFVNGEDHHDHHGSEGEEGHHDEHTHGEEHEHGHEPGDFHDVVDPHGARELHYHAAFGIRLLDERLTLEGRFHGVHVVSNDTPDRDYLRAGLRTSYSITENWAVRTEASVPISDARRNQWQTSVSLQVSF
ncbi:hypothetical protein ACXR0O_05610 [Verrucomicrobiota bacterium sgz303538]